MDMTQEQIEKEFRRQVRLCSGIGFEKQLQIVLEFDRDRRVERREIDQIVENLRRLEDAGGKPEPREVMKPPTQDGDWG